MADKAPADPPDPTDRQALYDLVKRAEKGDARTLPALRTLLEVPAIVNLCGDLARHAAPSPRTSPRC